MEFGLDIHNNFELSSCPEFRFTLFNQYLFVTLLPENQHMEYTGLRSVKAQYHSMHIEFQGGFFFYHPLSSLPPLLIFQWDLCYVLTSITFFQGFMAFSLSSLVRK